MHKSVVQAIIGCPPGKYSEHFIVYDDPPFGILWDFETWSGDEGRIQVIFDSDDLVRYVLFIKVLTVAFD